MKKIAKRYRTSWFGWLLQRMRMVLAEGPLADYPTLKTNFAFLPRLVEV